MRYRLLLYTLIIVGLFSSTLSVAQSSTNDTYTSTIPGAQLYPVPKDQFFGSNHREVIDQKTIGRPKNFSDPQRVQIVGLTNNAPSLGYDTYIVMLKGKRYYVHKDFVQDNSYLENENDRLQAEYERLVNAVTNNELLHSEAYNRILAKIDSLINDNERAIRLIDTRADSLEFAYVKQLALEDISKARANNDKYFKWVRTLPQDVQPIAERFSIISHTLDATPSGAYNYSMTFVNWSSKTIKNIYWNGHVKNAQGEYISCQAKGISTFSDRFSGPVSPNSREYTSWNNVIYNKEAYQMELTSLKIEYTDDTSLILDQSSLQYISNIPTDVFDKGTQTIRSAYEGMSDSALKAPWVFELNRVEFRNNLRNEKQERQNCISSWKETKRMVLEEGLWSGQIEHMGIGLSNSETYKEILNELRIYGNSKRDKKTLDDNLLKFKRMNLMSD